MDRVLTIEDQTALLAEELAALTGLSVADAVAKAITDQLAREREAKARFNRIMAVAAEIRSHMQHPLPSSDHSWIYGEDGLPA